MEDKAHTTPEGLKKIRSLKSGMNTGRICDGGGSYPSPSSGGPRGTPSKGGKEEHRRPN